MIKDVVSATSIIAVCCYMKEVTGHPLTLVSPPPPPPGGERGDGVLRDPGEGPPAGGLLAGPHAREPVQQQRAGHQAPDEGHQEQDLPGL